MAITIQTPDGSLYVERSFKRHIVLFHDEVLFDGEVVPAESISFASDSRKYVLQIAPAKDQSDQYSYVVTQQDGVRSRTTHFGHNGRRVGGTNASHGITIILLVVLFDRLLSWGGGFVAGYGYAAWLHRVRGLPPIEIQSVYKDGSLFAPFTLLVLAVQMLTSCVAGAICYRAFRKPTLLYPVFTGLVTGTLTALGALGLTLGAVVVFDTTTAIVLGGFTLLATVIGGCLTRQYIQKCDRQRCVANVSCGTTTCRNPKCNVLFQTFHQVCPICGFTD